MSKENVEVVRRAVAAVNAGDVDRLLTLVDAEIEFRSPMEQRTYRGIAGIVRYANDREAFVVMLFNFTPVPRQDYRIGVPAAGWYAELLNSDSEIYGGSNIGNGGGVATEPVAAHGFDHSLRLTVPPHAQGWPSRSYTAKLFEK